MALVTKCVDCPDRQFDNPGSARGHANRMGHQLVEIDEALAGEATDLETIAEDVAPETGDTAIAKYPEMTGELGEQLDSLADQIRTSYAAGQQAVAMAWDARYRIAQALAQARKLLRSDLEYGRWVKEQNFPFASTVRGYLQWVGEYQEEAKEIVDTSVEENGDPPALRKVASELKSRHKPKPPKEDEDEDDEEEDAPPRHTATELIHAFLYGNAAENFASVGSDDEDFWSTVSADDRRSFAREFETLNRRMGEILEHWR